MERTVNSWEKHKTHMNKKFLPKSYKQDIYRKTKQNNLSVSEYMREFKQILLKSGIHEPQEQIVARFLNGLNPFIAKKVESYLISPWMMFAS